MLWDHEGRVWRDADMNTSEGIWRVAGNHQKLQEAKDSPDPRAFGRSTPLSTSWFCTSNPHNCEKLFLAFKFASQFMVICQDGPTRAPHTAYFSFKQEPVNTDIIPLEEAYDLSRSKKFKPLKQLEPRIKILQWSLWPVLLHYNVLFGDLLN